MKHILDIGWTSLRLYFKRRSAIVWLFVVPLGFVYCTGAANRGPGDPHNRTPPVLIENHDTNFLGRILLDELSSQDMWVVGPTNQAEAARVIKIPANFTSSVLAGKQSKVQFLKGGSSGEADSALLELRLVRALVAMNGHLLEAAAATNAPGTITEAKLREVMARSNPVSLKATFAGRKPVPSGFNFSVPGNLVMFIMMNLLIFGGAVLSAERQNGVIKRLMASPVARRDLVMGKIFGLMLMGLTEIIVFLAAGKFLFHINLGANLPGVAVTLIVFTWVAGSLGVLIGSLVASPDRVNGICVMMGLLMAAIGGCWWPVEIGPPAMKTISLCVPSGWAMACLHRLISFGADFSTVLLPLSVLAAFGAAANLLAIRYFKS